MVDVVTIQLTHVVMHSQMHGIIQEVPVKAVVVLPFDELAEFTAHKEELLAGMSIQ